jgi:hypothetical protein
LFFTLWLGLRLLAMKMRKRFNNWLTLPSLVEEHGISTQTVNLVLATRLLLNLESVDRYELDKGFSRGLLPREYFEANAYLLHKENRTWAKEDGVS